MTRVLLYDCFFILIVVGVSGVYSEVLGDESTCGPPSRMTASQRQEIVELHNYYRALNADQQGIADTVKLVWCDQQANLAQKLADSCLFSHGYYLNCNLRRMGQNLYFTTNPQLTLDRAVLSWYREIEDYNQTTRDCRPGKMCGHYTQLVWSAAVEVGCAVNYCPTLNKTNGNETNAWLVVCNYGPEGNIWSNGKVVQYGRLGTPCSQCRNAISIIMRRLEDPYLDLNGFKCDGPLCAICLPNSDNDCQCVNTGDCTNGGIFDNSSCTCNCPKGEGGYWGKDCQHPCSCIDTMAPWFCKRTREFGYCDSVRFRRQVERRCPFTCDKCIPVDPVQCNATIT